MNELINIIVAIAFPFTVIVVAWLVFRNNRIKAKKPTINDRYNQTRQMATHKEDDETEKFGQFLDGMSAEDFEELENIDNEH